MSRRNYTQKKRAAQQEATRQKIIDAAVDLHGSIGPRNASIKAIAERAGVERLTVYRHFPDLEALFMACTGHWLEQHPLPESSAEGSVEKELTQLYDYYSETREMWSLTYRDYHEVPGLQAPLASVEKQLSTLSKRIAGGSRRRTVQVTARHLVAFPTWEAFDAEGLDTAAKCQLALIWLQGAHSA